MNTKQKVLKQILENKERTSVQFIAKRLGMGNDYVRYLCRELAKQGLVEKLQGRDWYKVTSKNPPKRRTNHGSDKKNLPKTCLIRSCRDEEKIPREQTSNRAENKIVKVLKFLWGERENHYDEQGRKIYLFYN